MTSNPLCTQYRRGHQHRRAIFKYHHIIVDLAIALYCYTWGTLIIFSMFYPCVDFRIEK